MIGRLIRVNEVKSSILGHVTHVPKTWKIGIRELPCLVLRVETRSVLNKENICRARHGNSGASVSIFNVDVIFFS